MRLAHCSDLHLLSHDGARWLDLANKRWIGAMNLISSRSRHYHVAAFEQMVEDLNAIGVDHVLCTGDVTNLASNRPATRHPERREDLVPSFQNHKILRSTSG